MPSEYGGPPKNSPTTAPMTLRVVAMRSAVNQYGNAFGRGFQAAALKPADFFGNDDVLYLMEDMATGEIRLSILWEWVHKGATLDEVPFTLERCRQLIAEEYDKLQRAGNRDVHDDSKQTTLPIAREIVETYVSQSGKFPWYVDLLNINIGIQDIAEARARMARFTQAFAADGTRVTGNLDFA